MINWYKLIRYNLGFKFQPCSTVVSPQIISRTGHLSSTGADPNSLKSIMSWTRSISQGASRIGKQEDINPYNSSLQNDLMIGNGNNQHFYAAIQIWESWNPVKYMHIHWFTFWDFWVGGTWTHWPTGWPCNQFPLYIQDTKWPVRDSSFS